MKLYLERLYRSYLLQNEIGLRTKASLLQLIDRDGIQTKIKSKDIPIGVESTTIEKVNVTGQNVQNKNIYQTGFTNIKGPWPKVGNSTATTVQAFEKPTTKINGEQSSRNGELKSSRNGELKSSRNDELKGIQNTGEECIQKSGDQGFKVRNNCETCIPIGNTEDPRKEIEDTIKASIGIDEPIKAGIKIEETIEPSIKMEDNIEPSIKMEDTIQESIKNGDTIEASIKNEDIIEGSITNGGTIDSRITNKDTSDIEIEKTTQQCLENKDTIEPSLENEDTIHISFDYADIIKEDTEIENVLAGIEIEHVESEELDSDNEADVLEKKKAIFKKATSVLGLVFGKMNFIELFEVKKMEAKLAKGENGQLKKFSNTLFIFMELKNAPNDNHLFNLLFLDESEKQIEINKYGNIYHFEFDQTVSGIEIKISQIDNITEDSSTEENVK
uniref:Uncharacterized protein n=1 Tax=Rhabditophanes sp. KR3021 TaxID=114890 RepID=A0AC35TZD9_9BILA